MADFSHSSLPTAETANDPRSTSGNTAGPGFEVPPGAIYIGPWPSEQFPQPTDLNPDHWVLEPGLCPGGCEIETPAGGWCPACWERVHAGRVLHCWEDYHAWYEATQPGEPLLWALAVPNATCLLPDGHEGPHVWTPDSEITARFAPNPEKADR